MTTTYRQPTADEITSVAGFHSDCCDESVVTTDNQHWRCYDCGQTQPVAPPRVKPTPRECEAGTTPCRATAQLYPCGWRCPTHRPGAPQPEHRENTQPTSA